MKRLIIPCICAISVFSLVGCANTGETQTLTSLNNQLDRVESIVNSTSVNEVADVSPHVTLETNEPYNSIQRLRELSNENMLREEELRQKVLSLNSQLKSSTNKKYKLGRRKTSALKNITSNLSKYTTNLNGTKTQVRSSVRKIKRNLKVTSINIEEATSSYTTLKNSMNERYAYLCNIFDNLEQACIILECKYECEACKDTENINPNSKTEQSDNSKQDNSIYDTKNDKGSFKIVKNIDSYSNSTLNDNSENTNLDTENTQNTPYNQANPLPYPNTPVPKPYPHTNPHFNYHGNNNHYNYFGNRLNPNRNTDTFYSFNKNIDTYRQYPYRYYNYNY